MADAWYHGTGKDLQPGDVLRPGCPRMTREAADGDYRMQHQGPDEDSDEALHEIGTKGTYPDDVLRHPDWYGAEHSETREKLDKHAGRPYSKVTVYRSLPSPHRAINSGDWVATAAAYARNHGRDSTDPKKDWPVVKATVRADQIRSDGNSLEEWSYHGPDIKRAQLHFPGGEEHRGKSGRGRTDSMPHEHESPEMQRRYSEMLARARVQKKDWQGKVDQWNEGKGEHPGQFRFEASCHEASQRPPSHDELPPDPGTSLIPHDHIRLWHYTSLDNADSIREHGLQRKYARGDAGNHDLSDPSAGVWASTKRPDDILGSADHHKAVVEYHAHPSEISGNAESPWQSMKKDRTWDNDKVQEWGKEYHHVIMNGDVHPSQISAIHEPWHHAARYMRDDDPSLKSYQWIKDEPAGAHNEHLEPYRRGLRALERGLPHTAVGTPREGLEYHHLRQGRNPGFNMVTASHEGSVIGHMAWGPGSTQVGQLWVHPDYRREGIAAQLWHHGRSIEPGLHHHQDRSDDGDGWARAVSGEGTPERLHDTSDEHDERRAQWAAGQITERIRSGHPTMRRIAQRSPSPHEHGGYLFEREGQEPRCTTCGHRVEDPVTGTPPVETRYLGPRAWVRELPARARARHDAAAAAAHLLNPHTGGNEWFHGTQAHKEDLAKGFLDPAAMATGAYEQPQSESDDPGHWNRLLGTHFTADHDIASEFARGEHHSSDNEGYGDWRDDPEEHQGVVHARLRMRNPKVYESEHHMDHEAYEHEHAAGNHPINHLRDYEDDDEYGEEARDEYWPNAMSIHRDYGTSKIPATTYGSNYGPFGNHPMRTAWLNTHPDKFDIAARFKKRLQDQGHDGVIYRNEYERTNKGKASNTSAIVFHPDQAEITRHHHADEPCDDRHRTSAWIPSERIFGPTYGLDHRLFDGEQLKPGVRQALLERLNAVLDGPLSGGGNWENGYRGGWGDVARAYLAGSEASKWTGPDLEGNGDIDVLVGIAYEMARDRNPEMASLTDLEIDDKLNNLLRAQFNESHWHPPWDLAGKEYDITGFVNHDAIDIRDIKPYAAYDLTGDSWAVTPPDLPDWDASKFPQGKPLFQEARAVAAQIRAILRMPEPYRTAEASALWDHIHEDRSRAFGPDGHGWDDPGNVIEKYLDQHPHHLLDKLRGLKYATASGTGFETWFHGTGEQGAREIQQHGLTAREYGLQEMIDGTIARRPTITADRDEAIHYAKSKTAPGQKYSGQVPHLVELHIPSHLSSEYVAPDLDGFAGLHKPLPVSMVHSVTPLHEHHESHPNGPLPEEASRREAGMADYLKKNPHWAQPPEERTGEPGEYMYRRQLPEYLESTLAHGLAPRRNAGMLPGDPGKAVYMTTDDRAFHALREHGHPGTPEWEKEYGNDGMLKIDVSGLPLTEDRTYTVPGKSKRAWMATSHIGPERISSHIPGTDHGVSYTDGSTWMPGEKTAAQGGWPAARSAPLYHGTTAELGAGDHVEPGRPGNWEDDQYDLGFHQKGHVFATHSIHDAWDFAEHARLRNGGEPHVYEVHPAGRMRVDPEVLSYGSPGGSASYRSRSPLRVVRNVDHLVPDEHKQESRERVEGRHRGDMLDMFEGSRHVAAEGYVTCGKGHTHWGEHGAAGLLIRHQGDDGRYSYLLQKRSPHVDHGGTWSTPGGALHPDETPIEGARREASEELGDLPALQHHHTYTDDHGGTPGWKYHTVVQDSPERFTPAGGGSTDHETAGYGWFTSAEMRHLPLHPGFEKTWATVRNSRTDKTAAALPRDAADLGVVYHSTPYAHGFPHDEWMHVGTRAAAEHRARIARPRDYGLPESTPITMHRMRLRGRVYPHVLSDDVANDVWGTGYVHEIDEGLPSGDGYHVFPYRNDTEAPGKLSYLVHRSAIHHLGTETLPRTDKTAVIQPGSLPERQRSAFDVEDLRSHRRQMLDVARNPEPGTRVWRGELRPEGEHPSEATSVGMHWSVNPDSIIGRADQRDHWKASGLRPVVWQGVVENHEEQAFPRSHPMWHGRHESFGHEAEVRFRPGARVRLEGAYTHDPPAGNPHEHNYLVPQIPERTSPNWKWHKLDHHVTIAHKPGDIGSSDYSELGIPKEGGQNGGLPDDLVISHRAPETEWGTHSMAASHAGEMPPGRADRLGRMSWSGRDGRVINLWVHPDYKRRGIATEMWNRAKAITPHLQHGSMSDDAKAWAGSLEHEGARHTAAGSGMMVALVPSGEVLDHLQQVMEPLRHEPEARDQMHVTVLYLGKESDHAQAELDKLPELIRLWAKTAEPFEAAVQGSGTFANSGEHPLIALVDIPGEARHLHHSLTEYLKGHGISFPENHSWIPHVTMSYSPHEIRFLPRVERHSWPVNEIHYVRNKKWQSFPLGR